MIEPSYEARPIPVASLDDLREPLSSIVDGLFAFIPLSPSTRPLGGPARGHGSPQTHRWGQALCRGLPLRSGTVKCGAYCFSELHINDIIDRLAEERGRFKRACCAGAHNQDRKAGNKRDRRRVGAARGFMYTSMRV